MGNLPVRWRGNRTWEPVLDNRPSTCHSVGQSHASGRADCPSYVGSRRVRAPFLLPRYGLGKSNAARFGRVACLVMIASVALSFTAWGQQGLLLKDYNPQSMLKVKETLIERSKFPCIDIHGHLARMAPGTAMQIMDDCNVRVLVDYDGRWGEILERQKDKYRQWPGRVIHFTRLKWSAINEPDFSEQMVEQLRASVKAGARGLKISKALGLYVRTAEGKLLAVNDPRLDPVWAECGKLGIPVAIHTADPDAFFLPLDRRNEQYVSLSRNPLWHFYGEGFPSKDELLNQRNEVIARHPKTAFIGLHVANRPENLSEVASLLDRFPNLHVEFGARVNELGRQPYTARKFFLKYQDRILFGVDRGSMTRYHYRVYFRFLETQDEYFPFGGNLGRWRIYGIFLPDEALKKIYYENAVKLLKLDSKDFR